MLISLCVVIFLSPKYFIVAGENDLHLDEEDEIPVQPNDVIAIYSPQTNLIRFRPNHQCENGHVMTYSANGLRRVILGKDYDFTYIRSRIPCREYAIQAHVAVGQYGFSYHHSVAILYDNNVTCITCIASTLGAINNTRNFGDITWKYTYTTRCVHELHKTKEMPEITIFQLTNSA